MASTWRAQALCEESLGWTIQSVEGDTADERSRLKRGCCTRCCACGQTLRRHRHHRTGNAAALERVMARLPRIFMLWVAEMFCRDGVVHAPMRRMICRSGRGGSFSCGPLDAICRARKTGVVRRRTQRNDHKRPSLQREGQGDQPQHDGAQSTEHGASLADPSPSGSPARIENQGLCAGRVESEDCVAPTSAMTVHDLPASELMKTLRLNVAIASSSRRAGFCAM